MKKQITVFITGGGAPGYPLIFKGLRASEKYEAMIIAGDLNPYSANLFVPQWVDTAYQLPSNSSPQFLEALLWIVEQERVDFLLSGVDEELSLISENAAKFARLGCKILLPPSEALEASFDKELTEKTLRGKIPMPRCVFYNEGLDLEAVWTDLGNKVVVKACRTRGNRYNYVVETLEDLFFYSRKIARTGLRFMIQEFVEGSEFNVSLLRDLDGNFIYSVCREKMDPPALRPNTRAGLIRRIPELERLAREAVDLLGLTPGMSNAEFLQPADGEFTLIEVNGGRHAAQDMNLIHCGINIPEMLYDLASGEAVAPVKDSVARDGVFCLKFTDEIIVDFNKLQGTLKKAPL